MKKIVIWLYIFLIGGPSFAQSGKSYLPSLQELCFPKEVVQNCFGIHQIPGDMTRTRQGEVHENSGKPGINLTINGIPLSFVLDGQSSRVLLNTWKFSFADSTAGDRIIHKIKWIKPDGTFEVRCRLVEYINHPSVEWKLYFKNTGSHDSPVLEKVLPLDASISEPKKPVPDPARQIPVIHCSKGSNLSDLEFMPVTEYLDLEQHYPIRSHIGRSSESFLPFWNLEYRGSGLVTALGWSGDWEADFSYPMKNKAVMQAGMSNIHLFLKPGEEISSPSVCLLYWEGGEPIRGHNLFRRYMRDVVVPKWNGKEPISLAMSGGSTSLETVNEKNQLDFVRKIAGTGAGVYWLDAGWMAGGRGVPWYYTRGNWFPDPEKFPNGLKVLADEAHKNGLKFLLWIDPEVVAPGTDIAVKHPEWVVNFNRKTRRVNVGKDSMWLFNLGNPQALQYLTDLISTNLKMWDVDIFRNDFGYEPGPLWKMADEPGRNGMTEIRYVEGLYRFWDELLKRKPDLLIDDCASGGRRIDNETCKRSVPLWRSDYVSDAGEIGQNQTYGLGYYLPFNSTGRYIRYDKYKDRSAATGSVVFSIGTERTDQLAVVPFDKVKQVWDDIKSYNYLMIYDFYPLTDFSLKDDAWMVIQYDCPEKEEGCILCFRREHSPFSQGDFCLKAIDPQANYRLNYIDSGKESIVKGDQLEKLTITLKPLESTVIKYSKINAAPAGDQVRINSN
jgi:alpha-galactosidase